MQVRTLRVAVYATREQRQIGSEQQLVNAKKFPQRQCIGCGEMKNKKEMIRILKTPEGELCRLERGRFCLRNA